MLRHWTSLCLILCPTSTGICDVCRFVWVVPKGSASISDMASGMQGVGESYSVTLCAILDRHFRSCTSLRQTDYSITCCQCILIFLKFIIKSCVLLRVESCNFLNSVLGFKQNYTEVNQCLSVRGKHLHKGNNSCTMCTIPIYYNNS